MLLKPKFWLLEPQVLFLCAFLMRSSIWLSVITLTVDYFAQVILDSQPPATDMIYCKCLPKFMFKTLKTYAMIMLEATY
jgi:hypothetical protein